MENKNVYIKSLEASDIYLHMHKNKKLNNNYVGMLPSSLELDQLEYENIKIKKNNKTDKYTTDDVINVKFNRKVRDAEGTIELIQKKIAKLDRKIDVLTDDDKKQKKEAYKQKLIDYIKDIRKQENKEEWQEVKVDTLRDILYKNGFTITAVIETINKKTGEKTTKTKQDKYVVYKRTSAKSRTGNVIFIKEKFYNSMINWSRIGLDFSQKKHDYPSLLAYESLVSSSLEGRIVINPDNILLVDDVRSSFKQLCNVVRTDNTTGLLNSFVDEYNVSNDLFDGESLLDVSYFDEGKSMLLLRNHMFKSAAFATFIQEFLRKHCPEGVNYDEWELYDMNNNPILAKDVHMITTPSSCKALKFCDWEHWKKAVNANGNVFGICKHEKESKRGKDFAGNIVQQTSYQMIGSIPFTRHDIAELTMFEKEYIKKLKNDDDFFLEYIKDNADESNNNMMMYDICKINADFMRTKVFRDWRSKRITKYCDHIKKGKIRLPGDYAVLLGNPLEYLYHSIRKLPVIKKEGILELDFVQWQVNMKLKKNEVYTTMFDRDREYVAFRNPHTSPNNCLLVKNKAVKEIDDYFRLTKNIVCVNAIDFPIQDILSSADYDSDSVAIFNHPTMTRVVKEKVWDKYPPVINQIDKENKKYEVTNENMAVIDNILSKSQKNIGTVVNSGALWLSEYWDRGQKDELLLRKAEISTVLSCVAIDNAKRMYTIEMDKEIANIQIRGGLRPKFFEYVSESKTIKLRTRYYKCAMDYLYSEIKKVSGEKGKEHPDVDFRKILARKNMKKVNREQRKKILEYISEMDVKLDGIYAVYTDVADEELIKERDNAIVDIFRYYKYYVKKSTIKEDTMYSLLIQDSSEKVRLMSVLYNTNKEIFLNAFKKTLTLNKV